MPDPMATRSAPSPRAHGKRWPGLCPVCGQWSRSRPCADCLLRLNPPVRRCRRCAIGVPADQALCGTCVRTPPPFERAVAALNYQMPWDQLIAALKFRDELRLLPDLSSVLTAALSAEDAHDARQVDWVVPMPLSDARLRQRGFNQAWELARPVASALGCPARADLLLRWRDTDHQSGLGRQARAANLKGAFMTSASAHTMLTGKRVALVDDVMTTGASAAEATRALLAGGAAAVVLWLLARTPTD